MAKERKVHWRFSYEYESKCGQSGGRRVAMALYRHSVTCEKCLKLMKGAK